MNGSNIFLKFIRKVRVAMTEDNLVIYRDIEEDRKETKTVDRLIIVAIILIIIVLPLIIRTKIINFTSPIISYDLNIGTGFKGDIFTYYKYQFLMYVTALIFFLFLYRTFILNNKVIYEKSTLLFFGFIITVMVSTIFSPFTSISLFGMYNRNGGALTTFLVVILFLVASNISYSKRSLLTIAYAFTPVIVINLFIGLSLFYGYDLMDNDLIKKIIIPSTLAEASIDGNSKLWTTINNPNYTSGYAAMITILYLGLAIFLQGWKHKVAFFVLSLLSFLLILTSLSQSGFLAFVIALLFLLLVSIKFRNFKTNILLFSTAIVIFTSAIYIMQGYNERVWDETFGLFKLANPFIEKYETTIPKQETRILSENLLTSTTVENEIRVNRQIMLPEFPKTSISAGTGRIYIWKKTYELILERPILGHGLDTLTFQFPQYDPEKQAGLRTMERIVDKPHNMYIGIAYGSGIFALCFFILGIIYIFIAVLKKIYTNKGNDNIAIIIAFFASIIAFLVQGIVNDPIIGTYPIFWILLGIIVSLLRNKDISRVST